MASLQGALHQGQLGVVRKDKVDLRYFVLYKDRLDYYNSLEEASKGGVPNGRLAVQDIMELEVSDKINGFRIGLSGSPPRSLWLQVDDEKDLQRWVDVLEPMLDDEEESEEEEAQQEAQDESDLEEVLHDGPLKVEIKGKLQKKHFWLLSDRLEFTNSEQDDEEVQGAFPLSSVTAAESTDGGFLVVASNRRLKFQCDSKDAASWVREVKQACRAVRRKNTAASGKASAHDAEGVVQAGVPTIAVTKPPEDEKPGGRAKTPGPAAPSQQLSRVPADASSTAAAPGSETAATGMSETAMVRATLCKGDLGIFRKGKVDKRFFVLFSTSFEYWAAQADFDGGVERRGCIVMTDVAKLEGSSNGFLIYLAGPENRTLELRCDTERELKVWLEQWSGALPPSVFSIRKPASAANVPAKAASSASSVPSPGVGAVASQSLSKSKAMEKLQFMGWKGADSEKRALVVQGELGIQKKGAVEKRHFVLFSDRLEYYNSAEDHKQGLQPRGTVALADVTDFSMPGQCFVLALGERNVQLHTTGGAEDLERWVSAWPKVFNFRSQALEEPGATPSKSERQPKPKVEISPDATPANKMRVEPGSGEKPRLRPQSKGSAVEETAAGDNEGAKAKKENVRMEFTLNALDFAKVTNDTTVKNNLISGVKKPVLEALGSGYTANDIGVVLKSGSVVAEVTVTPKAGANAADLAAQLGTKKATMESNVKDEVVAIASIEKMLAYGKTKADIAAMQSAAPTKITAPVRKTPDIPGLIHMGTLTIDRRGKQDQRHFVIFENTLDYFGSLDDMVDGADPRGRTLLCDIRSIEFGENNFQLHLQDKSLLLVPENGEKPLWEAAWRKAGIPCKNEMKETQVITFPTVQVAKERQDAPAPQQQKEEAARRVAVFEPLGSNLIEGTMGLLRGLDSSSPEPKHFVLFHDRLDCFTDASAARRGQVLHSVRKTDIQDLDILDAGFDIVVGGQPLKLRALPGVEPGREDWIAAFAEFLEEETEMPDILPSPVRQPSSAGDVMSPARGKQLLWQSMLEVSSGDVSENRYCALYEDCFLSFYTPNDMADGCDPASRFPVSRIIDLEVMGRGFALLFDTGDKISLRVGSEPGLLEAWVTNWQKVLNLRSTSAGQPISQSVSRAALLKKPVTSPQARQNSQGIVHQGLLEMERGSLIEMRYIVVFEDRLENYKERTHFKKGERPKSTIKFNAVQEFKAMSQGFYIMHQDISLRFHTRQEEDFAAWMQVLGQIFYMDGEATDVIYQGPLLFMLEGKQQKHHFVIYADRIDYYAGSAEFDQGKEKSGQVNVTSIRSFKVLDDGFVVRLDKDSLELRVVNPKDLDAWLNGFRTMFTGGGATAPAPSPIPASSSTAGPGQNFQGDRRGRSELVGAAPPPPPWEEVQSPLVRQPGQDNVAMLQGPLGIQHGGRLMKKFFVLYPDRLDYFESAMDAISGKKPLGRIALSEVTSHEVFGVGLILDLLGRKVGLKADHDADVNEWDIALRQAMAGIRPPGFTPTSAGQRPRPRSSSPRKKAISRVYDFRNKPDNCGGAGSLMNSDPGRSRSVDSSGMCLRSPSGFSSASTSPLKRQATSHMDSEGWVHLHTFNRWQHAGGRPWASTEPSPKVMEREGNLQDHYNITQIIAPKLTGNEGICSKPPPPSEAVARKVNVPDEDARLSIRRVKQDQCARHGLTMKITAKATYGKYPNYTISQDRTFLQPRSPDADFINLEDKITSTPARLNLKAAGK